MSLSTYALITADEIKEALSLQGSGMDIQLEGIAIRVSDVIETYLQRQIITRGALTEYHSLDTYRSELYLTQYPVITVTSAKEGLWTGGSWVAATTLVANTDYVLDKPSGKLIRMASNVRNSWAIGFETVQVVYTAGVVDTAAVPAAIKGVALSLACRKFAEAKRGGDSVQQVQDGLGMVTRFMPSELLRIEKEMLAPLAAWDVSTTGRVA